VLGHLIVEASKCCADRKGLSFPSSASFRAATRISP
jgi:hypothetical protein